MGKNVMEESVIRRKIARGLGERQVSHPVEQAISVAKENKMKPVLVSEEAELLLLDPYSGEHFLFSATGPQGEYETRQQVGDISVGEPIPDRFLTDSWGVIDPDWRYLVESDRVAEIKTEVGDA
jgi:hypothetical protein